MTEKGLTMERSPSSGLGVGVFSPHIGGGGGAWDQQQNAIITKIASTPSNRRSTATDNQERERRRRRSADKNAMVSALPAADPPGARANEINAGVPLGLKLDAGYSIYISRRS